MAGKSGPDIVENGLVLCLDAANKLSYRGTGTAWTDLSGNNSNGTLTNGPTFSAGNQGSIVFDGTNDYVVVGSKTYTYNGGSWEIWTKLNSINRQQGFMGANVAPLYLNFFMGTNNLMRWEVIGNSSLTFLSINSTTVFTTGIWYHVIGTFNGVNNTLYINGVQETTTTTGATNIPTTYAADLYLGDYGAGAFPGAENIAISRIYNRALSAAEVLQNYNATKIRFGR